MTEDDSKLTPMMRQYQALKAEIPRDAVLLFRLGDFYELFFEDAVKVSKILGLTLTQRNGTPMCGVPWHSLQNYLHKLMDAGLKIAVADQTEDPRFAKGLVKRELMRIITPGALIDPAVLSPSQSNYLASLVVSKDRTGFACLEISSGNLIVSEFDSPARLEMELHRRGIRECLAPEPLLDKWERSGGRPDTRQNIVWTPAPEWFFTLENAEELLKRHFKVASLDGFGCRTMSLAVQAAGAALRHASENLKFSVGHIKRIQTFHDSDHMALDPVSQRNLELAEPLSGAAGGHTLLSILDETKTPMGGRMLRDWVVRPLFNSARITERLDAVGALIDDSLTLSELRETLSGVRDMERITARLSVGNATPRDLTALRSGLDMLPGLKALLRNFEVPLLAGSREGLHELPGLAERIARAIADDPPLNLADGGVIRDGYNTELDEFRKASTEGKGWLASLQAKEQERTGIKSLKVGFNNVFGYYIEISKSNIPNAPADYIRKQTLTNAERFITPELKEMESKILGAEDKAKALEARLFQELREFSLTFTAQIQETAASLAVVDVLASLAVCAMKRNYKRPKITDEIVLDIRGGRHPVLDALMSGERFVPNDALLDGDENRMMIITGPNMAGKSTYIRQTALITIMAQMGSFVPADSAVVGLADRIFTRVGAADDISRGQSTFMVEMIETANILNHATPKSLVILDEIGRGTSTFDGVSIAWAVAEFLHDNPNSRARTQFATHYHELTELALTRKGVKNYNVAVREYGDQIIFLRQIIPGSADKSYGIHVAKLAGLPGDVITRAAEILENLESGAVSASGQPALAEKHTGGTKRSKSVKEPKIRYKETDERVTMPDDDPAWQPSLFEM
jgi:DNA mismatch repair protein MutS